MVRVTRASKTSAIGVASVLGVVAGAARAQTGMAATGGGGEPWWFGAVMLTGGFVFVLLIFWGAVQGTFAFFPGSEIGHESRRVLRWVGLNFLEPAVTSILVMLAFANARNFDQPWQIAALIVLPIASVLTLFAPLSRSSLDARVRAAFAELRLIAWARTASLLLTVSSLWTMNSELIAPVGSVGVLVLGWSWWRLGRQFEAVWPVSRVEPVLEMPLERPR
jgi:hypothetical protein